ncbi:MAG: hypothetical protein ACKO2V_18255, partial [Snowella sp.]
PKRGLIIAGLYQEGQSGNYCQAIADIAEILDYPVLADALSPVRHFAEINPNLITNYDFILRNQNQAELLTPEIVIQIGELPTSKQLRTWLTQQNVPRYIIDYSRKIMIPCTGKVFISDFLGSIFYGN